MECVFCKIISGEIPSEKIYEDDDVIAFLDISPINKGHTLIVPKKHAVDVLDAEPAMLEALITAAKRIAPAIMKGVGAQGFNIGINNGSAAGQIVMHLHLHIIPRFKNDGLKHWPGRKCCEEELKEVRESIARFL